MCIIDVDNIKEKLEGVTGGQQEVYLFLPAHKPGEFAGKGSKLLLLALVLGSGHGLWATEKYCVVFSLLVL